MLTMSPSGSHADVTGGGNQRCWAESGEYATSSFGYTYNDVETPMGKLTGEVDVLHVNHHGSSHSSNKVGCA